jgi:hypothetical protein
MKVSRSMVNGLLLISIPLIATAAAARGKVNQCLSNCPPPVGSITAPAQVGVPAGGTGTATIRWTWNQSHEKPVTQYSCLWVSGPAETNAHIVQCERPGHVYTIDLPWIGMGTYTFRVAPSGPRGPFTKPIAVLPTLAQATVVGVAR